MPRQMHLLYDGRCGFCVRCISWLRLQPTFFPVSALPYGSQTARTLFPSLVGDGPPEEVIAIADGKDVYRGDAAWIMCLYALRGYRGLSFTFASPGWRPLVRKAVGFLARHREGISAAFSLYPPPPYRGRSGCEGACPPPISRDRG